MSVQAISWAIETSCPTPTSKLVLMCLANYSDKDGYAYPGQKKLAKDTGLSVSTIKRSLAGLEVDKIITRNHRHRRNGSRTSDEYFLQISKVSNCDIGAQSKVSSTHDPRCHSDLPHKANALFEPSVEPSVSASASRTKKQIIFYHLSNVIGDEMASHIIDHRKTIKAPLTDKASSLLASQFSKCADPIKGAEMMIANGWRGFKAEWFENANSQNGKSNGTYQKQPTEQSAYNKRKQELAREYEQLKAINEGF